MADVNRAVYKKIHEGFVSGHNGTTITDIALVASSAPVSVLLRNVILAVLYTYRPSLQHSHSWRLVVDFCCLILPVFMCIAGLPDHVPQVLASVLVLVFGLCVLHRQATKATTPALEEKSVFNYILDLAVIGKKPFITNYRAYANIASAICILAVDFVIFPRRFCKTETYGTGLMDVATGGFIFSNAIVSPEARGKYATHRTMTQRFSGLLRTVKSTVPLWVLGFCRLAAVKGVDYHEHVSEYGLHWNFFFTLALVKLLSSVLLTVFDPSLCWLMAVAVASGYEYLLSGLGYRHTVLHGWDGMDSRRGFLEANREGIFSSLGCCALFFAGVQIGTFLWQPRSSLRDWVRCWLLVVLADVVLWVVLAYTEMHMTPVSRRLANLPYVIWILAYSLHMLAAFLFVDLLCTVLQETGHMSTVHVPAGAHVRGSSPRQDPCLLEATNRNGLFFFLLANLLTGAVNLSMYTVNAPPLTGGIVVGAYMLILTTVTAVLHSHNITLRFW